MKFALAPGALRPNDFIANVRKAIAAGLPRDVAVEALTIRAAEIAGVGDQLGSIEPGKIADLVVSDGPPLARQRAHSHGVRGRDRLRRRFPRPGRPQRSARRRGPAGDGGGEMAQVAGTWTMTVNGPQGAMTSTMTLTQTGDAIDGNDDLGVRQRGDLGRARERSDRVVDRRRSRWAASGRR